VATPDRGARNLVFIATTTNTVYAYDADNYRLQWSAVFGTPFPSSAIDSYNDFLDCAALPDWTFASGIGIVGTPVIDAAEGAMYFVANTMDGPDDAPAYHHVLHKIRLSDGVDAVSPVEIAGSYQGAAFDSRYHLQRAALLLLNGRVYIAFASHHDETPYFGWMFSYDTKLQQIAAVNYAPARGGAGIWQSGGGPASDGSYLYFNTGNDPQGHLNPADNSESILQVDPVTLQVVAKTSFDPEAEDWDYFQDLDLSSSRVILMPGTNRIVTGSKYGDLFSVNLNGMLMEARQQAAARHSEGPDWTGVYNGFAYWNHTVYVWPGGGSYLNGTDPPFPADTLKAFAFKVDFTSINLLASGQNDGIAVGYQGSAIVISANGDDPASGIVWASTPALNTLGIQPGYLRAYSASDLSGGIFHELWNNATDIFDDDVGCSYAKFNQPLVANGKVFLPTASQRVLVYGMLPPRHRPSTGPVGSDPRTPRCSVLPVW